MPDFAAQEGGGNELLFKHGRDDNHEEQNNSG